MSKGSRSEGGSRLPEIRHVPPASRGQTEYIMQDHVIDLNRVARSDVARVGGKNASLGEMIRALGGVSGIKVPPGFATTAEAYRAFLRHNDLTDRMAAAAADREASLAETGRAIRALILGGDWPPDIADAIRTHYTALCDKTGIADLPVAVRSSATAEDLPEASFAGQQETVLNVRGSEALLDAFFGSDS